MALLLCDKIEKGMPMETIISACISAGVTLLVCMISNHSQQEKTRALMEYKHISRTIVECKFECFFDLSH